MTGRLWGGRFTGDVDPLMQMYNDSLPVDEVFWSQDIKGSIAFARANSKCGVITEDEFKTIEDGLQKVGQEWQSNTFEEKPNDEDIHTANERRLGEIIGKGIAGKLHTGRSRNDQVVTDMRMWLREGLREIEKYLVDFVQACVSKAETDISYIMPGYTHLQKAQPVRWSHWLLSHAMGFATDLERLREVIKRVNRCPLGCGALAGNPFNIDREAMAKELGFDGIMHNSMNAVGDRDFVLEALYWGSFLMTHISRFAEDLIIYCSLEFAFVSLDDKYSTGSSLMPQKKNPDSLELLRGKSATIVGSMVGVNMALKGLPTTYNKDLQETVKPMLEMVKTVSHSIQIANSVISTLKAQPEKMLAALTPEMLATEMADYLVRKGVPFREGHHVSGQVVVLAEKEGVPMDKLSYEQLKSADKRFEPDVKDCLDYERAVELKSSKGGTSKSSVLEQIAVLKEMLGQGH